MVNISNEKGSILISNDVFTWLAGDAATRCFGVKGMAGLAKDSGLVQLLRRTDMTKGVTVTMDEEGGVSISLHIVVDHGINMAAVCESIRREVSYKVSSSTNVPVRRVDVYIDSITMD